MSLIGLSIDPPFDPTSFSGISHILFKELIRQGTLSNALHVKDNQISEALFRLRNFKSDKTQWRAAYKSDTGRFTSLSKSAVRAVNNSQEAEGVFQIGARISVGAKVKLPVFGYQDGNAAMRYRYVGNEGLSENARKEHLAYEHQVYKHLQGIFLFSAWLGDSFMKDFSVPANQLHVVGAGINFSEFPNIERKEFNAPQFLFVGKEFERKGGKILLEAFAKTRIQVPNAKLVIVGPDVPSHVPDGVTFAGFLRKSDPVHAKQLLQLFNESTTLILPSIYEPFGISILEGMAYGMPSIVVDRCAMPEIVAHKVDGMIAKAEDVDSLASAMTELASNLEQCRVMGKSGHAKVKQHYTWEAVCAKMADVLKNQYGLLSN
jgi:glycosyltransferase involved in cell wall biosynthesis